MLRELSRVVLVDRTLNEVLTDVTRIAAQGIPGAEATSITLLRDEKAFTAAHHGEMALAADELQYEHGYGPVHGRRPRRRAAARRRHAHRGALAGLRRARRPDDAVRSSLSVPLPYQGTSIGALNNYSTKPAAFASPESLQAGLEVAEVVAVAVANADAHHQLGEQTRNMRVAMESRAVIEQAKGVLMAQRRVDAEQAFEILREASQRYNRKLRDIAARHRGVHPGGSAPHRRLTRSTPPCPAGPSGRTLGASRGSRGSSAESGAPDASGTGGGRSRRMSAVGSGTHDRHHHEPACRPG